jgi:hypothetical protein
LKRSASQLSANSNYQRGQEKLAKAEKHKPKVSESRDKGKALRLSVTSQLVHDKPPDGGFLLDSGASAHMCPNRDWFQNMHHVPTRETKLGDNSVVTADSAKEINRHLPYQTVGTFNYLSVMFSRCPTQYSLVLSPGDLMNFLGILR